MFTFSSHIKIRSSLYSVRFNYLYCLLLRIVSDISSFKLLKDGGKSILPQGECITLFNQINDFLKEHNIFILECGEIERFVPEIDGHGNTWVEKTFNKYQDINDHAYDEARQFIKSVFHIDGEESFKNL